LAEAIYTCQNLNPDHYFIEKHGAENLTTLLVVLNKYTCTIL
jgi:hypothetical protein